jgi:uncharacterized protein YgiM (DUF1202 family)
VENSKFAATGIISSNAVYVRCGPGDNYYPTQKLDKGAKVKVVGAKFDWLKIEPPDGSFCYVAKLYVDRHGDGKVGRVNKDSINVRAGSHLSALKIGILCELHQGEEVEITGEEQEYFKINPPKGAYLFVSKRFVEPDPAAQPVAQAQKPEANKTDATAAKIDTGKTEIGAPTATTQNTTTAPIEQVAQPQPQPPQPPQQGTTGNPEVVKPVEATAQGNPQGHDTPRAPTTNESAKTNQPDTTQAPVAQGDKTAKPAVEPKNEPPVKPVEKTFAQVAAEWTGEQAEAAFDKAEADYFATRNQPMSEQPIESLVERYEALSRSDKLPESMRRVAEARLPGLQARATARAEMARLRASEDTLRQRQIALKAEQEELQRRIAERTVQIYTAVGTLQPSSLQQGAGTLYRITDPATGRTVCYLRSSDGATLEHLGQFVGVKGQLAEDSRLGARVIQPTSLTQIDPGKVHTTITAHIIPPSLIPREASTDPIN